MAPTGGREGVGMARVGVAAALVVAAMLASPAAAHAQTGTISGRLTNAATGAVLTGASVRLCEGVTCTSYAVDAAGRYLVTLTPGTYTIYTQATGVVNEIFDEVPCPFQCDDITSFQRGAPIVVVSRSASIRNFALSPEGTVSGVVRVAGSGAPLLDVQVTLAILLNGRLEFATAFSGAGGRYTVRGVSTGTYVAFTRQPAGTQYVDEMFGDIPCLGPCSASTAIDVATPIAATTGVDRSGIDFALESGSNISGTVRSQGTGTPLAGLRVSASQRVGGRLVTVAAAVTSAFGTYSISGLPAGTYVVHTKSTTVVDEVYDGVRCAADCRPDEIASGRPVPVPPHTPVPGVDFNLSSGGALTGRLTDAATGTPLQTILQVFLVQGATTALAATVTSNSSGVFSATGLSTGSYVVLAQPPTYTPEVFGGAHVPSPNATSVLAGTRVTVNAGAIAQGIDIALDRAASIRGKVRLAASLIPVEAEQVMLFEGGSTPRVVTSTFTDVNGNYTLTGFPAGIYYVATAARRLDNQGFGGFTCPGGVCTAAFVTSNTFEIPISNGFVIANVDFTLGAGVRRPGTPQRLEARNTAGGLQMQWDAPSDGPIPASYVLEAGLSPGTTFATVPVVATSLLIPGVPPGTYFLRVRGVNGAGTGAASNEIALRVAPGGVAAPEPPEDLLPAVIAGRLSLTWIPPQLGPRPSSYQLEVGTAASRSDIAVLPVSGQVFQFNGVPPGVYFVRLRSAVGTVLGPPSRDVTMVVGDVPAPPSEPTGFASTVAGNVVTFRWSAPFFGPVTDYTLEAGTQPGAANIAVFRTGSPATSITIPGVPPGRYFLRIRAVNALGVGAQSEELELVVP